MENESSSPSKKENQRGKKRGGRALFFLAGKEGVPLDKKKGSLPCRLINRGFPLPWGGGEEKEGFNLILRFFEGKEDLIMVADL